MAIIAQHTAAAEPGQYRIDVVIEQLGYMYAVMAVPATETGHFRRVDRIGGLYPTSDEQRARDIANRLWRFYRLPAEVRDGEPAFSPDDTEFWAEQDRLVAQLADTNPDLAALCATPF